MGVDVITEGDKIVYKNVSRRICRIRKAKFVSLSNMISGKGVECGGVAKKREFFPTF